MINKRVDNKWKNSILCVLIFGVAAVIGIGTGGKATETEEIQMMEWADETEKELESESETETERESAGPRGGCLFSFCACFALLLCSEARCSWQSAPFLLCACESHLYGNGFCKCTTGNTFPWGKGDRRVSGGG